MWTRQWRRPPTGEELTRLVTDHLREEVLAREAMALELDVGDTVIRRRLAQKMAFLLDDTIQVAEPPEAEEASAPQQPGDHETEGRHRQPESDPRRHEDEAHGGPPGRGSPGPRHDGRWRAADDIPRRGPLRRSSSGLCLAKFFRATVWTIGRREPTIGDPRGTAPGRPGPGRLDAPALRARQHPQPWRARPCGPWCRASRPAAC